MKKTTFLLLCIAVALMAGKPDWVENRPVRKGYYIGIGSAAKGDAVRDEARKKMAKERALADLASEIFINIKDSSSLQSVATTDSLRELYIQTITAKTANALEGYEFVGDYDRRGVYYCYYELSHNNWFAVERMRTKKAAQVVASNLTTGDSLFDAGRPVAALGRYVDAYAALDNVLYLKPIGMVNGREVVLASAVNDRIQRLLTAVTITADEPLFNGVLGEYTRLRPTVSLSCNGAPLTDIGLLVAGTVLKSSGTGTLFVPAEQFVDGKAQLALQPALLLPSLEKKPLLLSWVEGFNWPERALLLALRKASVKISTVEEALDYELDDKHLLPALLEGLQSRGYGEARGAGDAEYLISVNADTRTISGFGSLHFVYLDMEWSIMDQTGKKLFTQKMKPVKDGGLDFDTASLKAYSKGAPLLVAAVSEWMESNL